MLPARRKVQEEISTCFYVFLVSPAPLNPGGLFNWGGFVIEFSFNADDDDGQVVVLWSLTDEHVDPV